MLILRIPGHGVLGASFLSPARHSSVLIPVVSHASGRRSHGRVVSRPCFQARHADVLAWQPISERGGRVAKLGDRSPRAAGVTLRSLTQRDAEVTTPLADRYSGGVSRCCQNKQHAHTHTHTHRGGGLTEAALRASSFCPHLYDAVFSLWVRTALHLQVEVCERLCRVYGALLSEVWTAALYLFSQHHLHT